MLLALQNSFLLALTGTRRWYIVGTDRHYLTRTELAELLAEIDEQPEVKEELRKEVKPLPKKTWKLIKAQVQQIKQYKQAKSARPVQVPSHDEDEELLFLFA